MSAVPLASIDERRAAIVHEALSWVGTPYHPYADVKGVGVDCAMLLVRVYQVDGTVAADFDPRPYSMQWYLHRGEPRYLNGIIRYCRRIEEAEIRPADIVLYNFGRHAAHGAIVIDATYVVHAYRPGGRVEKTERRALQSAMHSCWSPY
jgi:cell wall-associated NlpC family hydrolase